jgi:hypothetical protein
MGLYMYQIHILKKFTQTHILVTFSKYENELVALDFGCMKQIPNDFYNPYFELIDKTVINDPKLFNANYLN